MKKIDTSNIIEFVRQLGATKVTLSHTIDAVLETTDAIVRGLTGNLNNVIVLYGCVNSGSGSNYIISAGAIWYNGEIYLVDAFTGTVGGGTTIVLTVETTYDANDPVLYSNDQKYFTHAIRKIIFNIATSGTGIVDFSGLVYLNTLVNPAVSAAIAASAAATLAAAKAYSDALVVGLWDDRGSFSAAGGNYPSSGGSGPAGAILKGDIWTISVAGTLPTGQVVEIGDTVRALVDTPGNTQANWSILQNNIGYVPVNKAGDSMTGNLAMGTNKVTGLGAATSNGDALRYEQVVGLYLLLTGGTLSGALNMGGQSLTNLPTATNPSDAVRFDQITGGVGWTNLTLINGWANITDHRYRITSGNYLELSLRLDTSGASNQLFAQVTGLSLPALSVGGTLNFIGIDALGNHTYVTAFVFSSSVISFSCPKYAVTGQIQITGTIPLESGVQ